MCMFLEALCSEKQPTDEDGKWKLLKENGMFPSCVGNEMSLLTNGFIADAGEAIW